MWTEELMKTVRTHSMVSDSYALLKGGGSMGEDKSQPLCYVLISTL